MRAHALTAGADAEETARMSERLPSLPGAFIGALETQWRALTGSKSAGRLTGAELDAAAEALLGLQRGLTGERRLVGGTYMDEARALGAYLLYYWPASYLQATRALDRSGIAAAGKVLDLGAGPGPASAACAARGASLVHAVDKSPRALSLARRLLSATEVEFEVSEGKAAPGSPPAASAPEGGWDLIVLSHSLNEFFLDPGSGPAARASFLESLAADLGEEGSILIIEPALLSTSRGLIAARDALLARGWEVLAPCIYAGPCPAYAAGEGQTCHDSFEWEPPYFTGAIADRAGLDRRELKMAWFRLIPPRPRGARRARRGSGDTRVSPAGDREASAVREAIVVSDPMLNKAGRTRFMVCGAAGRFSLSAKLHEVPRGCEGFAGLRRGMHIRFTGTEERGGGAGLKSGSLLEIIE